MMHKYHLIICSKTRMLFKIMSYNIWFDKLARITRTNKLIETILKEKPNVVCLQEVVPETCSILLENLQQYYPYHYPSALGHRYGCFIFSKHSIIQSETKAFLSNMGRLLDVVTINLGDDLDGSNSKIIIGNTHFESEFDKDNVVKKVQYKTAASFLQQLFLKNSTDENFIEIFLCSDTNVTQYEENDFDETFKLMSDAWIVGGQNDNNKYTYDTKTNIYIRNSEFQIRARLDRILFKNAHNLKQINFKMIGSDEFEISDHYGIIGEYEITN
jgi:endonuclease/exonuclease/phosphatase family metal-dependent hydrolase